MAAAAPAASVAPAAKKVRHSTVVDQATDWEVPEITREAVQQAYANRRVPQVPDWSIF